MIITQSTILEPRLYVIPEGITIAAEGVTLDGNGATLVCAQAEGAGVRVAGFAHVTIKNLRITGFEHGIHAVNCTNLRIEGCQMRGTAELAPNAYFLDIFRPPETPYGGGIYLREVFDGQIEGNDLSHQMCGLLTYHCQRLIVRNNVANYCSGFGYHLFGTSHSLFEENFADFCCRWERRGGPASRAGHMGADAAGFVIVFGSSGNVFRRNFARLSGDGFFLAGLTSSLQSMPCNDNRFEENDASWSPNIAFEATFSQGNRFRKNVANYSNYGFWLGFSRGNVLEENLIVGNRQAGIAGENGVGMQVRGNEFKDNGHGILLWSKRIPEFDAAAPHNDTSRDWLIERNHFHHNRKAILIAADQDHGVRDYATQGTCPPPRRHTIRRNQILNNQVGVELIRVTETEIQDNVLMGNVEGDVRER